MKNFRVVKVVGVVGLLASLAAFPVLAAQGVVDPTGFDPTTVAIGDVALLPFIVGLIQFIKRFFPKAPGNVWLFTSFLLGVVGESVVFVIANGAGVKVWDTSTWAMIVVYGLAFGLAASKAYDELIKSKQ